MAAFARTALLALGLGLLVSGLARAGGSDYVRGYAQALLDTRHAPLGVEARAGEQPGQVTVVTQKCLDNELRQQINNLLTGSGPILSVDFDPACEEQSDSRIAQADPTKVSEWTWLPTTDIFQPLQADPREPRFALGLQLYDAGGEDFVVGEVSAGETIPLVEGPYRSGAWQLGIQGGVFSIFDQERESNDLLSTDYLVGFPLSYRKGEWSTRIRYYHLSSHLGDEFILNEGISRRLDISYEAIDALVSRDFDKLRVYGGGGYIVRTTEGLDRGMLRAGSEWRNPEVFWGLDFALAADIKAWDAQDWGLNQSYQAALILKRNKQEVRFILEYYRGDNFNAQFLFDKLDYIGLGVKFGL